MEDESLDADYSSRAFAWRKVRVQRIKEFLRDAQRLSSPNVFELRGKIVDEDPHCRRQTPLCHEYQVDRDALRMPFGQNAHETPLTECVFDDLSRQQGNARSGAKRPPPKC